MATAFFEDLWNSIFTPGPTPPLLLATNVTFAALQLVLLTLLILTYSIHFIVLSVLSAGLWSAINWFAKEVRANQAREEDAERRRKRQTDKAERQDKRSDDSSALDTDMTSSGYEVDGSSEDTETELDGRKIIEESRLDLREDTPTVESFKTSFGEKKRTDGPEDTSKLTTGAAARPIPGIKSSHDTIRKRNRMAESTGSLSTDSEWEKIESER